MMTDLETEQADEQVVLVRLTPEELGLVLAGLRLMLDAEDDPETIAELKRLLRRLTS